ncbi:hypothetical protein [Winogradskyella bathintestinalis]|uniref:Uncharacterized protein n=1 Tax=Winogradskyella bathintestinalis TaxID=3035208 RepID=A0ABT7ZZ15_9FLAO|nr:hypothetical protein [Winogradskyella bathintestinalis]MDN3494248.1 hypothetical protein [Winogradskyella bathintestinalis]
MEEEYNRKKYESPIRRMMGMMKKRQFRIGMILVYLGAILFVFDNIYNLELYNSEQILKTILRFSPIILMVLGIGYLMFGYLEGNKSLKPNEPEVSKNQDNSKINFELKRFIEEIRHNQERGRYENREIIKRLEEQFEKQSDLQLNKNQKDELFNSLKESFTENVNDDFFEKLNENISIELTKEKRSRLDFLLNDFESIKRRLSSEIEKLSRKANINLVIGSLTTIVALITLSLLVFQNGIKLTSYTEILYHYLPRLSLIIFIEVFAYFFLRLYKLNLNDMKYFQNELTTVELKLASITTAINFGKDIDISAITLELAKTERNFILKKGETTVELEKAKINKSDINELVKSITNSVKVGKN